MLQGVERQGHFFQSGIFAPVKTQTQGISVYQQQTVFNQPTTSLREAELRQQQNQPRSNQQNQQDPTTVQARLSGQNVSDISDDTTLTAGGSRLSISGDSVTFENISGDTLTMEADTEARIYQSEEGGLVIQNRTSGEELNLSAGETLTVGGEGTAEIETSSRTIELESGEQLLARQTGTSTELVRSGEAESIAIGEEETDFTVSGDSLSLLGDGGQAIRFEAGEEGTVTRSESGELTVTNSSSGESVSFEAGQELSVFGLGEGVFEGTDELEISGPGSLEISSDATGNLSLVNPETAPSTEINSLDDVQEPQKPLQLEVFSSPELERLQTLQTELIQRPLEEQRAAEETEEDTEEETEENTEEESEESPAVDREETEQTEIPDREEIAPASFNPENPEAATPASLREDEENEAAAAQNSENSTESSEEETFELPEVKLELLEEDEEETTETVQDFNPPTQTAPAEINEDEMASRLTSLYASATGSAQNSEIAALYA